jgi:serine protease DegS
VNSLGELMGINTLSFDKSNDGETPEGIGFAIPFQLATKIMDKLIRDGRVIRGYIGISGRELRRCMRRAAGSISCRGSWLMMLRRKARPPRRDPRQRRDHFRE